VVTSSANASERFDAISLDLFGTLVFVEADRLPRARIDGHDRIVTIPELAAQLKAADTRATVSEFIRAAFVVATELAQQKARDNLEVPSHQRFLRILARLGIGGDVDGLARALSEQHMATLAQAVVCPPERSGLLERLAQSFRLVLISNFDHARTAHTIMRRDGLAEVFDSVVISEEVGVCKPAAEIFTEACRRLEVDAGRCLHVGDSWQADVEGAHAAGLEALWVDAGSTPQFDMGVASGSIAEVSELPLWLGLS